MSTVETMGKEFAAGSDGVTEILDDEGCRVQAFAQEEGSYQQDDMIRLAATTGCAGPSRATW
jgi:hypothetical protein